MHDDHVPAKNVGPDLLESLKYERRDVSQQKLWGWIVIFFIGFIVSMFITAGIYAIFIPNWYKLGQVPAPSPYRKLPPVPQLQVDARRDMELYRQIEAKQVAGSEGAVPNTKPSMTIEAAIDKLAGEEGIAGIKGTEVAERGTAYPGSRNFNGVEAPAEDTGKSDLEGGEAEGHAPEAHGAEAHGAEATGAEGHGDAGAAPGAEATPGAVATPGEAAATPASPPPGPPAEHAPAPAVHP